MLKTIAALALAALTGAAFAGDYTELTGRLHASAPKQNPSPLTQPSHYRAHRDERGQIYNQFAEQCGPNIEIFDSDEVNTTPAVAKGYWLVFRRIPEEDPFPDSYELRQIPLDRLMKLYPNCDEGGYEITIGVGSPTFHPLCEWSFKNDPPLFIALGCKEWEFRVFNEYD